MADQNKLETKVKTPIFRVAFPNVVSPKEDKKSGALKYELTMLFPKDTDLSALEKAVSNAIKNKWGDKPPKGLRKPFRDGDEKEYDGYAGHIFVPANNRKKPLCIDYKKEDIESDEDFYGGCYAVAKLEAWAYDANKEQGSGPGVKFFLQGVQKVKEGEPFGAKGASRDDFEDVSGINGENPEDYDV